PLADAPPCVAERATFMSPRPIQFQRVHPFTEKSAAFAHFLPTPQAMPPYSAQAVPFRWMTREQAETLDEERRIGLRAELEELVDSFTGWTNSNWVTATTSEPSSTPSSAPSTRNRASSSS